MLLASISIKRPVFATVIIIALVIIGLVSYYQMNVDNYPKVEFPFVTIRVEYPGAGPEQVETKISQKIEDAVNSVSGIKHINSYSYEGMALVFLEFTLDTPAIDAAQEVRTAMSAARGTLPKDAEEPIITRFDPTQEPILSITVSGPQSNRELSQLVKDKVKRRLETVKGVGKIEMFGNREREIHVNPERDKLTAHGLTIGEVTQALQANNGELPAGELKGNERELSLRTMGNLVNPEAFLDIPIARRDNQMIYLRDIATVTDDSVEATSAARLDGNATIGLNIIKQSGSNTVEVADSVHKALADLQKELPPGVQVQAIRDTSTHIRDSLREVLTSMIEGGMLAVLMVFLFLGNWRSTAISAIAIPASVIATYGLMKASGFTLNTMTLMALSLAIGMLIDDAIVVIENIYRHMDMGKTPMQAALEGTQEIGLAVMATTFTIVAVFLPVAGMTGIVGQFFKEFGLTVSYAVLISLFIALTLTPMLSSRFLTAHISTFGSDRISRVLAWWDAWFKSFQSAYLVLLRAALQRRKLTIAFAALIFFGSLALTSFLGSTFMPVTDQGEFVLAARTDPGLSLEAKGQIAGQLEQLLQPRKEIKHTYTTISDDTINMYIKLVPKEERKLSAQELVQELRPVLQGVSGVILEMNTAGGLNAEKPLEISVRGDSQEEVKKLANIVAAELRNIPGTVDVDTSLKEGKPNIQIHINRDLAADLGVSVQTISETLWTLLTGTIVTQYQEGSDQFDVRLRLGQGERSAFPDLDGVYVESSKTDTNGVRMLVPLTQLVAFEYSASPTMITRVDRQQEIKVTSNLAGASLGDIQKILNEKKAQMSIPPGYKAEFVGEAERMNDSFTSIVVALALAVVFIYLVLAAQFESFLDPLSIMFSLPMAIIGAILALLIAGSELSIMSMIGIIMLMGLVTKNAILLVDFAKQIRSTGVSQFEAFMKAGEIRLRPILMTTFAMIFGMLPLALAISGAEDRAPMAQAIIGGLITSTLLTLILVPVVYSLFDDVREWVVGRRQARPRNMTAK
jgi:hydrophobe/amphiphile efflux-1 (HAE1) family protein